MEAIQSKSTVSFMRLVYQGGSRSHPNSKRKEVGDDQTSDLVNLIQEIFNEDKTSESYFLQKIYEAFKVTAYEMQNVKGRKYELVKARQLHMYVRKFYFGMSYSTAAGIYKKDHATAMHAKTIVHNFLETDRKYRSDTSEVWKIWKNSGVAFPKDFNEKWLKY